MSRCDAARTEEEKPVLKWLVLPIVVCAYLAVTVSADTPRDRDHDRLPDRWERSHRLSPTRPSAERDPDRDRLSNLRELRLRTHPRRADTDHDRLRDGVEVRRFHTNPRRRDTDGDGFSDRCELRKGTNPRMRRSRPERPCSKSPPPDPAPPPDGGSPPPPPPAGEPGPITGQGYRLQFQDQFDTLGSTNWGKGIWYDPGVPASSIFVQNGILNLVSRRSQGYQDITVSTEGGDNPVTFEQGYFEARMRWTKGNGAWPAFWLLSYRHALNSAWPSINPICAQLGEPVSNCYSAELDVFEGQGSEPNVFYGTIHRNSSNDYGVSNQQNANNSTNTGADLTAGFHTYGMLWTATQVKWYLDGQLLETAPVYDSTDQPMFLLLQMWNGGWTGGTDSSTPDELKTEVDWVRVWQK